MGMMIFWYSLTDSWGDFEKNNGGKKVIAVNRGRVRCAKIVIE